MHTAYSVIISDLHLSHLEQPAYQLFCRFLDTHQGQAEKLFILGDFFEFWIGDDDPNPFYQTVCQQLNACATAGTQIFFMHGNRDFLLGQDFCRRAQMTLLQDPTVLNLYGHCVQLTHGDLLCTDDIRYQRYRTLVSKKWLQKLFLRLPLSWRLKVAAAVRQDSHKQNQKHQAQPHIADVTASAVKKCFESAAVDCLIHGHTHRFGEHHEYDKTRLVLSDWNTKGSYIQLSEAGITLNWYP